MAGRRKWTVAVKSPESVPVPLAAGSSESIRRRRPWQREPDRQVEAAHGCRRFCSRNLKGVAARGRGGLDLHVKAAGRVDQNLGQRTTGTGSAAAHLDGVAFAEIDDRDEVAGLGLLLTRLNWKSASLLGIPWTSKLSAPVTLRARSWLRGAGCCVLVPVELLRTSTVAVAVCSCEMPGSSARRSPWRPRRRWSCPGCRKFAGRVCRGELDAGFAAAAVVRSQEGGDVAGADGEHRGGHTVRIGDDALLEAEVAGKGDGLVEL